MAKKKVLIVDDEEPIRQLVSNILAKDYTVLVAIDGEEAINMARCQKPDLILMDMLMPKVDGFTACYTINQDPTTRDIPVVMLTGIDYELNKKLSREIGAQGYITKPFSPEDLRATVGRFLKGSA